jgi:bacterioferritin-associated ferredoxin
MYVCICHGVTHSKIEELVDAGAETLRDVLSKCPAGSDCGSCVHRIDRLISSKVETANGGRRDDRAAGLATS